MKIQGEESKLLENMQIIYDKIEADMYPAKFQLNFTVSGKYYSLSFVKDEPVRFNSRDLRSINVYVMDEKAKNPVPYKSKANQNENYNLFENYRTVDGLHTAILIRNEENSPTKFRIVKHLPLIHLEILFQIRLFLK